MAWFSARSAHEPTGRGIRLRGRLVGVIGAVVIYL